jgi:hypothetical protein
MFHGNRRRRPASLVRIIALCIPLAISTSLPVAGSTEPERLEATRWWSLQTGVMTGGRAPEALNPTRLELTDNFVLGAAVGAERMLGESRFALGLEAQALAHFGDQGFYELAVVPLSLRYYFARSPWDAFDSVAFGLGYSHYSELSQLEVANYDGSSRRNLIYWYLDLEFDELENGANLFLRLHHRSNGYDTVEPNGGSNAWIFGIRHRF